MKRKCNLELKLLPSSDYFNPCSDYYDDTQYHKQKQMTIFYNGQMAVSDVTELQARTIILLASREMEERSSSPVNKSPSTSPTTPLLLMQPHTPSPTGMSMKRSLQRFLQKRNSRSQAASPYHH